MSAGFKFLFGKILRIFPDAMTAIYDAEGNSKKASDFLAEFGKAVTITVEDPSLDPEDSTLTYRILEAPELTLPQ